MSDSFYLAVITVNALVLSFGGLLIVNIARGMLEMEGKLKGKRRIGFSVRRGIFAVIFVGLFLASIMGVLVALQVLGGMADGDDSTVFLEYSLTIAGLVLLSAEVGGAVATLSFGS